MLCVMLCVCCCVYCVVCVLFCLVVLCCVCRVVCVVLYVSFRVVCIFLCVSCCMCRVVRVVCRVNRCVCVVCYVCPSFARRVCLSVRKHECCPHVSCACIVCVLGAYDMLHLLSVVYNLKSIRWYCKHLCKCYLSWIESNLFSSNINRYNAVSCHLSFLLLYLFTVFLPFYENRLCKCTHVGRPFTEDQMWCLVPPTTLSSRT